MEEEPKTKFELCIATPSISGGGYRNCICYVNGVRYGVACRDSIGRVCPHQYVVVV